MIEFLFALHAHQPVGNFESVFRRAVEASYHPFLEKLAEHPLFRVAIHYSGCLLEWIEAHRPDHVNLLRALVERGQVEILGGGFYEPILSILPERDARGQILSYSDHLEQLFGKRPRGIWLTERVWDPWLPELLAETGVEFTLVDDSHFRYAGVEVNDIWGPFLAESRGHRVLIFPIDKHLRYIIPFREPEETINYLRQRAEKDPDFVACYGDDSEKFGMWPGTREWVFEKGWLRRFFRALEEAGEEIELIHFSEYLSRHGPRGRVYLPPASYEEMMEWVLPPRQIHRLEDFKEELKKTGRWEELAPFVRGGHWDMFLAKYEESNRMHKRMLLASERLARRKAVSPEERTALYRSQCNCAYWHGVFGGLYLNYLRHAVYEQILEAEALAAVNPSLSLEKTDYDLDGAEELIVSSPDLNVFVSPHLGGSIVALEYPPRRFSLGNVMSRREEGYHRKLSRQASADPADAPATIHEEMRAKEPGLEKLLVYDRFPRVSLQDHIIPFEIILEEIEKETWPELGDFAGKPYLVRAASADQISLEREARSGETLLRITKNLFFTPGRPGFSACYLLSGLGPGRLSARLGVEFNLTLLAGEDPARYYLVNGIRPESALMTSRGRDAEVKETALVDEAFGFQAVFRLDPPALLFRFPVETVSQSESGYERTYQGSALWFTWPLELSPGAEMSFRLEFALLPLRRSL